MATVEATASAAEGKRLSSALPPGSELSCTTIHGDTLRGDVVAVDDQLEVVVLKDGSAAGGGGVHIVNLTHVSSMEVVSPPPSTSSPPPLPEINFDKVRRRLEQNIAARWNDVQTRGVNVSPQAQALFDSIRKLYDDIRWDGDTIVVLADVRIPPPYSSEDCTGSSTAVDRIRKLVTKFHEEQKVLPTAP